MRAEQLAAEHIGRTITVTMDGEGVITGMLQQISIEVAKDSVLSERLATPYVTSITLYVGPHVLAMRPSYKVDLLPTGSRAPVQVQE